MSARPVTRRAASGLLALALPGATLAQGFAGLGTNSDGFALPDPETRFAFPADHGPHPAFRIEWWYVTANLEGPDGTLYGIQWTLFRNALSPDLPVDDRRQIWMAHAGLTTPDRHFAAERFARGGTGLAGVTAEPFDAWIDEWRMTGPTLSDVTLTAQGPDFAYDLSLTADGPFVPQGADGYSVKAASGQASHYYSQPFYKVTGTLVLPDGPVAVTGRAWLDREWSSQPLAPTQTGWDWVSLHLADGTRLMAFRLRDADAGDYLTGTWIAADGTPVPLGPGAVAMDPLATTAIAGAGDVPTTWRLAVPGRGVEVELTAVNPRSWMDVTVSYWEGPVTVTGTHTGVGYLEMTGYG